MTLQEYDELYRGMLVKKMKIITSGGVTLLNKDIASEEMSLEESLCSDENLRYGACESSCFSIRIVYSDHSFVGEWLDVYQSIYTDADGYLLNEDGTFILNETGGRIQLESEADATVHIGRFKVFSDKPTNDRLYRDLVCYDLMYDILNADVTSWSDGLTFPMTVKNFRDSFFTEIGVTQETTTLVNDNFNIIGNYIVESSLSGKTIIEAICELNGVFGHINRDGKFEYITLPSDETIEYPYYVDGSGAYEDYETEAVTGIIARSVEGDLGTLVGTNDNIYYIDYNPLLFGSEGSAAMEDALENLLDVISEVTYRPFKITTYGNPMLPLGTNVIFATRNQTVESFVMNRVLRGIQALKDDFSAVGEQIYPKDINSARNEIKQLNGKAHVLRSDVDQLYSEVYDEQGRSVIQQMSNEIVLKVDSNGKLVKVALDSNASTGSTFTIDADYIDIESSTIKFDNNGYKVNGEIYSTEITPDNYVVKTNYLTWNQLYYPQDYTTFDMEFSKNLLYHDFAYTQCNEDIWAGYQHCWFESYNSIHVSSPVYYHYPTYNPIDHMPTIHGDAYSGMSRTSVGLHLIMTSDKKTVFENAGGTVGNDGYIVFPNNEGGTHDIWKYLTVAQFSCNAVVQIESVQRPIFGKIKAEDFFPYHDFLNQYDLSGSSDICVIDNGSSFYIDVYGYLHAQAIYSGGYYPIPS